MQLESNEKLNLFATAPKGLELLLVEELRALGAETAAEKLAGVQFSGDLTLAYRACLWSRLANRILLPLEKVLADTPDALYQGVQKIAWEDHLSPDGTLAVHFVTSQSAITHSLFGAQKVKDAIVDQFREKFGVRPSVAREKPDLCVYVYLYRDQATISLDLSGESLHKRGYRLSAVEAPLKENLAAAILLRARWPEIAKQQGSLMDPMCGSGTLLIEGAMMAGDVAPGLSRDYFGFLGWKKHQANVWAELVADAKRRQQEGRAKLPSIIGYDADPYAIKVAFENIERAGFLGHIHVEKRDLSQFEPPKMAKAGLVAANPPYGERLGEMEEIKPLYTQLGDRLKQAFSGWQAAVLTGNPELGKQMGLRAKRHYALFNGAIPCQLLLFDVTPAYFVDRSVFADNERTIRAAKRATQELDTEAIQMFVNRLRKNLKHFSKQAKRQGLATFRVYDADLPEYAFAIDLSEGEAKVQEYEAPRSIAEEKILQRRQAVLAVLPDELHLPASKIFFTVLSRPKKMK